MEAWGDMITANASKIIREAAIAAVGEAIQHTPVKTGKARINWNLSAGKPNTKVRAGINSGKVDSNRQMASVHALINASNAVKNWKVGKGNIYIANSVSYIVDLNKGTSAQARSGMTIFAIAAAKRILKKGRLLRG